ncbi:hypothetical protein ABIE61_001700 [Marinobacterium sp. MBR-111]|jgi:hypothetical protein
MAAWESVKADCESTQVLAVGGGKMKWGRQEKQAA